MAYGALTRRRHVAKTPLSVAAAIPDWDWFVVTGDFALFNQTNGTIFSTKGDTHPKWIEVVSVTLSRSTLQPYLSVLSLKPLLMRFAQLFQVGQVYPPAR